MLSPEDITDYNGIPLSIIGAAEIYESATLPEQFNKHHPEHPNAAPELQELKGRVTRHSRVQIMPIKIHDIYHTEGLQPVLPSNDFEHFKTTLLHHGDYLAADVIDVSDPKNPFVRPLENGDLSKIRVKPEMGKVGNDGQWDSRRKTGEFLANYIIAQDIGHLKGEINKFLDTESPELKLQLAWKLIHEAARVAIQPIAPEYIKAQKIGRFAHASPPKLTTIIFNIFTMQHMPIYVPLLEKQLADAA